MANETYNILQGIFNGQTPIQRSEPMSGQSEYYYMKPNQNSYTPLSQMQTVDVPSATTPNPYLREEKNAQYSQNTFGDYFAENITDNTMTDNKEKFDINRFMKIYAENLNNLNPGYRIGETANNLYEGKSFLRNAKVHGLDNYVHRLAMCQNAQDGIDKYLYTQGMGLLNEAKDLIEKTEFSRLNEKEVREKFIKDLIDSGKDIKNNFEGANWGLLNPNKSCIMWLKDLDYKNNVWKNKND